MDAFVCMSGSCPEPLVVRPTDSGAAVRSVAPLFRAVSLPCRGAWVKTVCGAHSLYHVREGALHAAEVQGASDEQRDRSEGGNGKHRAGRIRSQ